MTVSKKSVDEAIFTVGDIAKELGVATHVVNHYAKNLGDLFGDNLQIDPSNNYRKFTPEGLRLMKVIRRMVHEEKKTLEEVREELTSEQNQNLPLPSRLELDMAKAYVQIAQDLSLTKEQTANMYKVMEYLTEQLKEVVSLPNVLSVYQDETMQALAQQKQISENLYRKLEESEKERELLLEELTKMKEEIKNIKSEFKSELENTASHIIEESEKHWATIKIPEKKEKKGLFGLFRKG